MDIVKSAVAKFLSGCALLVVTAIAALFLAYILRFDICTIAVSVQPSIEFCRPSVNNAPQPDINATAVALAIQQTSVAIQQNQPTIVPQAPVPAQPQPTAYVPPATDTPIPALPPQSCWVIVWQFTPTNKESIFSSLTGAQSGFTPNFDTENGGSLRVETTRTNLGWSWMDNKQRVEARNGLYRVVAMIKTQNTVASHISVVGQDVNFHDVVTNGSNQMAVTPSIEKHNTKELTGNLDWATYYSSDFNPIEWNPNVKYIVVGLNAGWSPDGTPSITWFKDVQIQYCQP